MLAMNILTFLLPCSVLELYQSLTFLAVCTLSILISSVAEMVEVEDQFLLQLCHVLHEEDTPEIPFPAWVDNAIHKLKRTGTCIRFI